MDASIVHSPRPVPVLLTETTFSQRKRTPFRAGRTPRSPAKSCPPVSRVFVTPRNDGPQLITFKSEKRQRMNDSITSPLYNASSSKSYFEQCFEQLERMGEGSFGEVFKVRSKEDGKLYAVKRSHQRFRGQLDRQQKLTEVEKHEDLPPHENCVRFHKAWEERQRLYIQTELCEMSLSEYADLHGRLPEREIWVLITELTRGLKHLHDNHLCHFDIKPANIFLGQDGITWKLGDFGLCISDEHGFRGAMEGDAKYMAPELMQGVFGRPADVFSLGISLLELACDLELPSGGANWHCLRNGQLPHKFIKGLSPDLISLLEDMMHPDPNSRLTVDQILSRPLVTWSSHRLTCTKMCNRALSIVKGIYHGVLFLIMLLFSLFPKFKANKLPDLNIDQSQEHSPPQFLHSITNYDDSFSDDDAEDHMINSFGHSHSTDDSFDPKAKFNRSWLNQSPMKYPSPVYTGPPIPLHFDDSSIEGSPRSTHSLRISPIRCNLNQSFSSHDESNISLTPNSKPTVSMTSSNNRNRNIGIEPKNLFDAFSDSSD